MVDPQTPVGRIESNNEESENDGSSDLYEPPPDPYPRPKRKQSSGPVDKDYIPEEEVYEH
jgi:hypothetical protein